MFVEVIREPHQTMLAMFDFRNQSREQVISKVHAIDHTHNHNMNMSSLHQNLPTLEELRFR